MASHDDPAAASERIDRWLCATRLFKTRALAVEAINNGRVLVNGARPKPAKSVRAGDEVTVRRPPYVHDFAVRGLAARRLSAPLARELYDETADSIKRNEALAATLSMDAIVEDRRAGKLDKKARRQRERLKRAFQEP
ncbi:MAG: RNA-binding S4 domain-containing protein [Gammaproteobacteria bacterium]